MKADPILRLLVLLMVCFSGQGFAGEREEALERDWSGSWVIVRSDLYSDCLASYTENAASGSLVTSVGARRFDAGELARVENAELRRSRLDLWLALVEPLLVPYPKGEFTLWSERDCRVELQMELPREVARSSDRGVLKRALASVVERFATEHEARASDAWNGRIRRPYPEDYAATLAGFRDWQRRWAAEQLPIAIARLRESLPSEGGDWYLNQFREGASSIHGSDLGRCADWVGLILMTPPADPEELEDKSSAWEEGRAFAFSLEMVKQLRDCSRAVAEAPPER